MQKIHLALTCPDGHEWRTDSTEGPPAVPEREYCPECGKKWVTVDLAELHAAIARGSGG